MANTLSLETMTVEEKIQAMEALWDSLCAKADIPATTAWHGDVLANREQAFQSGKDRFEDWEQAKKAVRKQVP